MGKTQYGVTWYATRRHVARSLRQAPWERPGREGTSLCQPGGTPIKLMDQVARNYYERERKLTHVEINELEVCPACLRMLTVSERAS